MKLPSVRVTAFFTDQFIFRTLLARILNVIKFHKPVRKNYRPKNDVFAF